MYELKAWVGTPTIFVLDCCAAGILMNHFVQPPVPPKDMDPRVDLETPSRDGSGDGVGGGGGGAATTSAHGEWGGQAGRWNNGYIDRSADQLIHR